MALKKQISRVALSPLSLFYGIGVGVRNLLFDCGLLKSKTYPVPIISVGNLTVGGTGKTPHIEYLIRLLAPNYRVTVLSRGYRRKSKGYLLADIQSTPAELGDEPYQMWNKFPNIQVAVDADRCHGIEQLLSQKEAPQVILLDDAYQHRYVKPGLSILLTDYNRPFYSDWVLPAGRLREQRRGKRRANLIVVSKTPTDLSESKMQEITSKIKAEESQDVFFSGLQYQNLRNVFTEEEGTISKESAILLVTGIARPELIEKKLKESYSSCESMIYADHHDFSNDDVRDISKKFNSISNKEKAIIVTEKDAVRLRHNPAIETGLKEKMYFLPLEIVFLQNKINSFNKILLDYVAENQRNC